jgi:NTE family protein
MATAIVTAGAGARGAYEAGVLSVVVPKLIDDGEKDIVLVGTSAGALNTAIMAGTGCSPIDIGKKLSDAWSTLDVDDVFTISALSLLSTGIDFAFKTTLHDYGLFDTQPLRKTVESGGAVDWKTFDANFGADGRLRAAAVVATQADTGASLVFVQGLKRERIPENNMPRGIEYVSEPLGPAHVLASAAIPLLFPSVEIGEHGWFIDGGVRLNTPISPGIDLLAKVAPDGSAGRSNRMIIVSTEPDPDTVSTARPVAESRPDIVDEGATILYSLFVDRIAEDVLSLRRINAMVGPGGTRAVPDRRRSSHGGSTFQVIEHCYFGPQSRGQISGAAGEAFRAYKAKSSHSLRGRARLDIISRALENSGPSHDEILSFILFDKDYLAGLVRMGQDDAKRQIGAGLPWTSYV